MDACHVLDTARESAFDNLVFIAAQLFRVPMAELAIVADTRVWLKASVGRLVQDAPRGLTFCTAVVDQAQFLVVEDALADNRFANLPIVAEEPYARFYAGVPLHASDREIVGALGVLDINPRTVPERARAQLAQLAREAEILLAQRSL